MWCITIYILGWFLISFSHDKGSDKSYKALFFISTSEHKLRLFGTPVLGALFKNV